MRVTEATGPSGAAGTTAATALGAGRDSVQAISDQPTILPLDTTAERYRFTRHDGGWVAVYDGPASS